MKAQHLLLSVLLVLSHDTWSAQFLDPTGDTTGPDLLRLDYQVANQALELKLTFVDELEGSVIDPAVSASILFDADRANLTGFKPGPGFHTRFGVDYEIEVFLGGFGPTSNSGTLKFWRRKLSSIPPLVELERVQIALGDWFDPNGSVFVVGADATYGTDNHQVFLRVPLNLFTNASFPICGEGTACVNDVFPCPLPVTQNLETAFLSLFVMDPYDLVGTADALPDSGMIDCATGAVVPGFPFDDTDLVASVTDPANDGWAQPGNNGEELTGLKVFRHAGGVLSFELKLQSYSFEDTAAYYVALDLDNNLASGEPWTNGTATLGLDLLAKFANFDNPIGWANPLEGTVYFRVGGQWCPLNYADYLATVWRSTPGYVYVTLPAEFTAPLLAANVTGMAQVVAMTEDPPSGDFNDVAPNGGSLVFAVGTTPVMQISSLSPQPDGSWVLRFTWNGPATVNFDIRTATKLDGTWLPEPAAVVTSLGNGDWQARFTPAPGQTAAFYRVLVSL